MMAVASSQDPTAPDDDDLVTMIEGDDDTVERRGEGGTWRVLILDDEPDVHDATTFAMRDTEIFGRAIALEHASSMDEALAIVRAHPDIALALVDVVMETTDAGLRFVDAIRSEGFTDMRIVLRTGQPGFAPELSVITRYDINDYRTKSELTRARLLGVVTSALRGYRQLRQIAESRRGLEQIIEASRDLVTRDNLTLFSRGVLVQIASLLSLSPDGLACVAEAATSRKIDDYVVIGDAGHHQGLVGTALAQIDDPRVRRLLEKTQQTPGPVPLEGLVGMHFVCASGRSFFVCADADGKIDQGVLDLLRVFASNVAVFLTRLSLIERLDVLAFTDPRVGLPNSNAFERELSARLETDPGSVIVLIVTVEDLDSITGAFGMRSKVGMLSAVHDRLQAALGPSALISWSSSRRFDIVIARDGFRDDVLAEVFAEPFQTASLDLYLTATSVIVDAAEHGLTAVDDIMRMASATVAQARRERRGETVDCDIALGQAMEERQRQQSLLRHALQDGTGFDVALQPKVDLASGLISGAEALIRWTSNGTPVSPATFIPLAETSGLCWDITVLVLRRFGAWQEARRSRGADELSVAVNLSASDAQRPGFAKRLISLAADCGLSPAGLNFEITEGAMIDDMGVAVRELAMLREAGFRIAIDDFGTGYSSLSHLDRLPIDSLKIDRAFVAPLEIATARDSLAGVIAGMAKALHLELVGEGVETIEQHQAMQFLGVETAQGYLYGRPQLLDAYDEAFEGWTMQGVLQSH